MSENYINFLNEEEIFKKKTGGKRVAKIIVTVFTLVVTFTFVYSLNALLLASSNDLDNAGTGKKTVFTGLIEAIKKINILDQLNIFIDQKKGVLAGENIDRVNILLLGIGGKNHDGGLLADTIMLASLKPSNNKASLLSIPRDLSVPVPGYGTYKINAASSLGEQNQEKNGADLMKEVVQNITGQPVDYYVRIDFSGFEKLIDDLGGICLNVENNLVDYQYPILGKENIYPLSARYEYLNIQKGYQCMDGSLALKYARSRHALGLEGTDFARAKRQQNVMLAVKNKVISMNTLLNPQKIIKILDDLKDNVDTDLKLTEILRLVKFGKDIDQNQIAKRVLDNGPESPLKDEYITTSDGLKAYTLVTKTGDFSEVQKIAQGMFDEGNFPKDETAQEDGNIKEDKVDVKKQREEENEKKETATLPKQEEIKEEERARIEIQNGTTIPGWAYETSLNLKEMKLEVVKVGNARNQTYENTVIYLNNSEKFKDTVDLLKQKLNAEISYNIPGDIQKSTNPEPDILIVLGKKS